MALICFRIFLFIWGAVVLSTDLRSAESGAWNGLWRLEQKSTFAGRVVVYHLFLPDFSRLDDAVLYGTGWEIRDIKKLVVTEKELELGIDLSGKPILFKGVRNEREDRRFKGDWFMGHPQFPQQGPLLAFKVIEDVTWQPFNGLNSLSLPNGLMDFAGYLVKHSPVETLESFVAHWDEKVEIPFYPILERLLYGRGDKSQERKAAQLKKLYKVLRNPDFSLDVARFSRVYSSVRKDLGRILGRELDIKNALVTMPPMEGFKTTLESLGGMLFSFVDVQAEVGRFPSEQFPCFLARQSIEPLLRVSFPFSENLAVKVYKEGIRGYLCSLLETTSDPSQAILSSEVEIEKVEDNLSLYSRQLKEQLEVSDPEQVQILFNQTPRPGRLLSFRMFQEFAQELTLKELLEMEKSKITEKVHGYFSSLQ